MSNEGTTDRFKLLHDIGRDINSSLVLDEVLNTVLDKLIELMKAERGFILLARPDVDDLRTLEDPMSGLTIEVARSSDQDTRLSRTILGGVIQSGQPLRTVSAKDDPNFKLKDGIAGAMLLSILCVPLTARGRAIGVIYVDNRLSSADLELLEAFSHLAATALDNARLFQELRSKNAKLEVLKRAMDAIFDLPTESPRAAVVDPEPIQNVVPCDLGYLKAGQVLWQEGEQGDYVVIVVDGALEVAQDLTDGATDVLATVDRGGMLGEISVLQGGQARSATVRASTDATFLRVSPDSFRELLRHDPHLLEVVFLQQMHRVRNLTARVRSTKRTAITDRLTSLYNFAFFRDRLTDEVERATHTGDPVSLIIFDIDYFKHYNDHNGHQEGNVCLARVASIIKGTGRRGDIIARYGGEEFVVLLYGATREEASRFAEAVRQGVEADDFAGGPTQPGGRVTVSGGVASYPEDASSDAELIEAADRNLYSAKHGGRNRIVAEPHPLAQNAAHVPTTA